MRLSLIVNHQRFLIDRGSQLKASRSRLPSPPPTPPSTAATPPSSPAAQVLDRLEAHSGLIQLGRPGASIAVGTEAAQP